MSGKFATSFKMETVILISKIILIAALSLSAWRILKGPHVADRVVAVDLFAALLMAYLVITSFQTGKSVFLEIASIIALVAFLATVAIGRFVEEGFLQKEDTD